MIDIETMSVLIVDDMRSMRLSIRNMFKQLRLGSTIRHAENGREALKMLNEGLFDLAVIDWNMPVMNGVELLGKIRNSKTLRDMPVIMVTAEADRDTVINVAETEIDAYLLKPLTMKALEEKVKNVIESANNPDKATIHLQKARELEEAGDIDGAINEMRISLKEKPNASRILRNIGLLYKKNNNEKMTEKCLVKAVSVNRQDDVSRFLLVDFYLEKNDLPNALNYYEKGRLTGQQAVEKGMLLAEKLIEQGMSSSAVSIFTQILSKSRENLSMRETIVNVCVQNGEYNYAKSLLKKIVEEQPERYDLELKLAKLYAGTNETDQALICFEQLDNSSGLDKILTPEQIISIKIWLAKFYMQNKKPFIADNHINQILKIDPSNETALKLRQINS
ncbi:Chemotaxis protein CheY (modular protein) [Desulfamplus magnetovallimortis]|uniref:Chemotaxis protein CheY (Modular protein) n=1 Tax=Desulfamplus magnetovallimortis TaxID=1246637 RepID=A0A1W1HGR7_9BACT|nr:response regulator [Desulfamplus magnetovallimortis]SLM31664.1 Chemotaxis protein CheY (modular protein) [Desulfamplus magnetovallimortis]